MNSTAEQLASFRQRLDAYQAKLVGISAPGIIYAAAGAFVSFGCKVTQGTSADDFQVTLEGQAVGDGANFNPDYSETITSAWQYANIANLPDGGFYSQDKNLDLPTKPSSGLARYDIAYIYVGSFGPGFNVAIGAPSAAVKSTFGTIGLKTSSYNPVSDVALPLGALPVARIYIADDSTGVSNSQIADIRDFTGRLLAGSGSAEPGEDGVGIVSIARTSGNGAAGSLDTYTITYTNAATSTYTVQNGANGEAGDPGIIVSATQPSNPTLNMLWLDIS